MRPVLVRDQSLVDDDAVRKFGSRGGGEKGVDLGFGYRFAEGAHLALDRGVAGAVAKIGDQVDAGVGRVDSALLGPIGEAVDVL